MITAVTLWKSKLLPSQYKEDTIVSPQAKLDRLWTLGIIKHIPRSCGPLLNHKPLLPTSVTSDHDCRRGIIYNTSLWRWKQCYFQLLFGGLSCAFCPSPLIFGRKIEKWDFSHPDEGFLRTWNFSVESRTDAGTQSGHPNCPQESTHHFHHCHLLDHALGTRNTESLHKGSQDCFWNLHSPLLGLPLMGPGLFVPWTHSECVGRRGSLQSRDGDGAWPGGWGVMVWWCGPWRCATERGWEEWATPDTHCLQASGFHMGFSGVWEF